MVQLFNPPGPYHSTEHLGSKVLALPSAAEGSHRVFAELRQEDRYRRNSTPPSSSPQQQRTRQASFVPRVYCCTADQIVDLVVGLSWLGVR